MGGSRGERRVAGRGGSTGRRGERRTGGRGGWVGGGVRGGGWERWVGGSRGEGRVDGRGGWVGVGVRGVWMGEVGGWEWG